MTLNRRNNGAPNAEISGDPLKTASVTSPPWEPIDWQSRLAERMAEHVRKKANQKAERQAQAERRRHGLTARHTAKLRRNREQSLGQGQ